MEMPLLQEQAEYRAAPIRSLLTKTRVLLTMAATMPSIRFMNMFIALNA
jgi:hypothetical protein